MKFPQYRRYKNGMSYFKILNDSEFVEYKKEGNSIVRYALKATILPDRNLIADMLHNPEPYWDVIEESEFLRFSRDSNQAR